MHALDASVLCCHTCTLVYLLAAFDIYLGLRRCFQATIQKGKEGKERKGKEMKGKVR